MEDTTRCSVTNRQVANDLDLSEAMVSRLRSGERFPSVMLMQRITHVYRWESDSQLSVFGTPGYARKFEECLERHYSHTTEDTTQPAEESA